MTEAIPLPKQPRRIWTWLKRLLAVGVVLLALVAAFHRQIILAVIQWAGPKGAATQNLPLEWKVSGSVWKDFEVTALKTGGGGSHWLPRATISRLGVTYDTDALIHSRFEGAIKSVVLHDADVELDLRNLPMSAPVAEKKAVPSDKPPPLVWPEVIDMENINVAFTLANGSRIVVRGLSLRVGKGMPGIFECREFRMELGGLSLGPLNAGVTWEPRKITITNLSLPQKGVLEKLAIDLSGYAQGEVRTLIAARFGAATFTAEADVSGLFKTPMHVRADLKGNDLRAEDLHALGLPKHLAFANGGVDLHVDGDPLAPQKLAVDGSFAASAIHTAGTKVDQVSGALALHEGQAEITRLKIVRGENLIEIGGEAALPADLKEWKKTKWSANLKATLPDAGDFLDKPPLVKGELKLDAIAEGLGATPTSASGEVKGEALAFDAYKLPHLSTTFAIDGKQARIEMPSLELGTGNTAALRVALELNDAMPVDGYWSVRITDAAALFATVGLKPPPEQVKGALETQGTAKFTVKDLAAQDFSKLLANVSVSSRDIAYGKAVMKQVDLKAHVENGKMVLPSCVVQFDAENKIDLKGTMGLQKPFAFVTDGNIALPKLTVLEAFSGPVIKSGAVFSKLNASGQLQPWQCSGTVTATASDVRTEQMPEAANAVVEAKFAGTRADLSKLEATVGPWKLSAKGGVDEKQADLSELRLWQKDSLLLDGRAKVPFDVMQLGTANMDVAIKAKDLRLHEVLASAGIKGVPAALLDADVTLGGRLSAASGRVRVNVRDVKVPDAPKAFLPASLDFDVTLQDGRVKSLAKVMQPPLQPLMVEAELPLDLAVVMKSPQSLNESPIKGSIRLPECDLSFLREYAPDMITSLPAKLRLDADITGTVAKPIVKASLDLDVSDVGWAKPDMPSVRDVRARIRASERSIGIEDVSAMLAGGRVKLSGSVDVTDPSKPGFDLKAEAREAMAFRNPTTSVRANANITVRGNMAAARVEGTVEAVRGRVFKSIDLMPALKLPADVPALPPDTRRSGAKLELPAILKDWTFDVKAKTRDPLHISGNLVNAAVSADVRLSGTGADPQLAGGANIDRMLLKLPFSLVKVTKGVVTLNSAKPFDPRLDMRGESRIGSNDIVFYVYGDSSQPKTRFTSTPPMSEPDIITLLATGTTMSGSASELATEAATRAAFLFLAETYRKTFNKKKVVREEPPKLNMTFNPSGADRGNDSVQASYDLTEKWRVLGRFTQSGRMRMALAYMLRFGKAAQAVEEVEP